MSSTVLSANHPHLIDGLCDGFRAPDLGWVGTQLPTEISPKIFEAGSLVFSNWWVGTKAQAKALAEALVQDTVVWFADTRGSSATKVPLKDTTGWAKLISPQKRDDKRIPVIAVGYWEGSGDLAVVGEISVTEDLMLGVSWPKAFSASKAAALAMTQVAYDGNDNYPEALCQEAKAMGGPARDMMADMIEDLKFDN